ncbi:vacuolar protein sorting-associated protein 13 [Ceratobasidium sp. AG-Ba]|nr:vacuolar protein sorting-associated protein 13 [Ceratobasidium sp. AG-Ba]
MPVDTLGLAVVAKENSVMQKDFACFVATGWQNPQGIIPSRYNAYPGNLTNRYALINGTFTTISLDCSSTTIDFYRLPSSNRGIDFKHWCTDFRTRFDCFETNPEIDILAGLELVTVNGVRTYKIDLRSMATDREHPDGDISLLFGELKPGVRECADIQINGHSLAIIQQAWDTYLFHADTWNWPSGRKYQWYLSLSHLSDPPELISEGHFAVLRTFIPDEIGSCFSENTFTCLDVYEINLSAMEPTPVLLVASFGLPPGGTPGTAQEAAIACALPTTASARDHPAAVYEPNVRERLLCVYIFPECTNEDLRLIHIAVSALLDMVSNQISITSIFPPESSNGVIGLTERSGLRTDIILIVVIGRQFTTRSVEPSSIANGFPTMPIQEEPGTSFYTGNLRAAGFYPKAILDIPPDGSMWLGVDDVHAIAFVRKRIDSDIQSSLFVYEF